MGAKTGRTPPNPAKRAEAREARSGAGFPHVPTLHPRGQKSGHAHSQSETGVRTWGAHEATAAASKGITNTPTALRAYVWLGSVFHHLTVLHWTFGYLTRSEISLDRTEAYALNNGCTKSCQTNFGQASLSLFWSPWSFPRSSSRRRRHTACYGGSSELTLFGEYAAVRRDGSVGQERVREHEPPLRMRRRYG